MPGATAEGAEGAFHRAVALVRAGEDAHRVAVELLGELTDDERLGLLDGDTPFWEGMLELLTAGYNLEPYVAGAVPRLGIPGIRFSDGPRGAVIGASTCFPVAMARGATWDPALEEEVGEAIGREIRAQGGTFFGGVCVNLLRHPAWGRAQETYGEDPVHVGAMGAALARGAQRHVMACVKHFACNSVENARFVLDVRVDERALHEVYLPHFRAIVEAGVAGVMSAYNAVNGEWCGQSATLLTDVLRGEWGFDGFVVSDFVWGVRDPVLSLHAGLDVELPFAQQRAGRLPAALEDGTASRADVERSALRILETELRVAASAAPCPGRAVVACAEHRALAREVARRSFVLLRNEVVDNRRLLPLDRSSLRHVAVLGRLARIPNTGDHGSSAVRPPSVVTVLDGLRAALPEAVVSHADGDDSSGVGALEEADLVLVVVGSAPEDEGEFMGNPGEAREAFLPRVEDPDLARRVRAAFAEKPLGSGAGDRARLTLSEADTRLVALAQARSRRVAVVLMGGSAVLLEDWRETVPAIVLAWFPGMEGGHALADVLLGLDEPGGRLPFSIPRSVDDLPSFDATAKTMRYDRWHGYRLLERRGAAPAFPFGFGLSYTSFVRTGLSVSQDGDALVARVTVTNVGDRLGADMAQLYVGREPVDPAEPRRVLVGFERVELGSGESREIVLEGTLRPLARRIGGSWEPVSGRLRVELGAFVGDPSALTATIDV